MVKGVVDANDVLEELFAEWIDWSDSITACCNILEVIALLVLILFSALLLHSVQKAIAHFAKSLIAFHENHTRLIYQILRVQHTQLEYPPRVSSDQNSRSPRPSRRPRNISQQPTTENYEDIEEGTYREAYDPRILRDYSAEHYFDAFRFESQENYYSEPRDPIV